MDEANNRFRKGLGISSQNIDCLGVMVKNKWPYQIAQKTEFIYISRYIYRELIWERIQSCIYTSNGFPEFARSSTKALQT